MFETLFSDVLDPEHELLRAARLINWDGLHDALSIYYSPAGRRGKPVRLMVGIHILKHRYDCSDERAVEMLHENARLLQNPALSLFLQVGPSAGSRCQNPGKIAPKGAHWGIGDYSKLSR